MYSQEENIPWVMFTCEMALGGGRTSDRGSGANNRVCLIGSFSFSEMTMSSPTSSSFHSINSDDIVFTPSTADESVLVTPVTSSTDSQTTDHLQSWKPVYDFNSPPNVTRPYKPEEALEDIPGVRYALEIFLSSHMLESEEYCNKADEIKCAHLFI